MSGVDGDASDGADAPLGWREEWGDERVDVALGNTEAPPFDRDAIRQSELHIIEVHPIGILLETQSGPPVGQLEFLAFLDGTEMHLSSPGCQVSESRFPIPGHAEAC